MATAPLLPGVPATVLARRVASRCSSAALPLSRRAVHSSRPLSGLSANAAASIVREAQSDSMFSGLARTSVATVLSSLPVSADDEEDINESLLLPFCVDVEHEDLLLERRPKLDLSAFPGADTMDPFALVKPDMSTLVEEVKRMIGMDKSLLANMASYFFDKSEGKKIRPTLCFLTAYAANATAAPTLSPAPAPKQARLAQLMEMIHTASLMHDDVIDVADTRRGVGSVNSEYGNQLAVLAGDFLLARTCIYLGRLRNVEVMEMLSTVIDHLVRGEVMQLQGKPNASLFDAYLRKSFYKTGSLIAHGCLSVTAVAEYTKPLSRAAFEYGKHLGIAFQLVDDLLDFEGTTSVLGKPALNDLRQGLATAPVLYAAGQFPELLDAASRKFRGDGDIARACECVAGADGVAATRQLAYAHGQAALTALGEFADTKYRTALAAVVHKVVTRDH